ncbi:hypothetical protein K470DRAFT_86128 [Piedraia hortae CBS 480.64]|uniref:Uncharacterized protein n=1 Tax=Piedraia hortae CBS 480.64 TaxID=1314780 RepID=A0A6A7BXP9_9PEZI|nr:hypothetical protein K470DRAFT_86128 [Piedraia hortae CBS 480.64]
MNNLPSRYILSRTILHFLNGTFYKSLRMLLGQFCFPSCIAFIIQTAIGDLAYASVISSSWVCRRCSARLPSGHSWHLKLCLVALCLGPGCCLAGDVAHGGTGDVVSIYRPCARHPAERVRLSIVPFRSICNCKIEVGPELYPLSMPLFKSLRGHKKLQAFMIGNNVELVQTLEFWLPLLQDFHNCQNLLVVYIVITLLSRVLGGEKSHRMQCAVMILGQYPTSRPI